MHTLTSQSYPDDTTRWQAVLDRDPTADGVFYYAVRSTGIYCRPTCPSRRPKCDKVVFFDTIESAEQAGFRSCRRCRPNEVSAQQHMIACIQHLLETIEPTPSLAELGEAVGLSPFHLQRLFKRATGLSPKQYATAQRSQRLKVGLKAGRSVTESMYNAGYGSSRALYETVQGQLGMRPSTYKKGGPGERIVYAIADSPLGRMLIGATEKGICALYLGEDDSLIRQLHTEFHRATLVQDSQSIAPYVQTVLDHLSGLHIHLDFPLDVHATVFQQRVWAALQEIPYGQTRSYREVAEMIGEPNAVRAVARACARNPVSVIVPCHRVVGADSKLKGYRWGIERKQALLEQEQKITSRRYRFSS